LIVIAVLVFSTIIGLVIHLHNKKRRF
jgi:hypothetical protein